jgi:hypothetical protein
MKRTIKLYKLKTLKYLSRVGLSLSILLNVILGGQSNQTFSARNYFWKMNGKPNIVWLIDRIFWFDPNHCLVSWIYWKTSKDLRKKIFYKELSEKYSRKDYIYYYAQE